MLRRPLPLLGLALLSALALPAPVAADPADRTGGAGPVDRAVDQTIGTLFDTRTAPGFGVIVIHRGKVISERVFGNAIPEFGLRFTPDTPVPVASVSKPVLASAVITLARDGRLSLDAPISRHWQGLPAHIAALTPRQLMSMSSGLPQDEAIVELLGTVEAIDRDELIGLVSAMPGSVFAPDSMNRYTYANWRLLARLVEKVTGHPYDPAMRALVFEPFGMVNSRQGSGYVLPLQGGEANAYREAFSETRWPLKRHKPYDTFGDGSLITSLRDLSRWVLAIQQPAGGKRPLFTEMAEERAWPNGQMRDYGLGLFRDRHAGGGIRWCHSGATGSNFCIYPELDLSIVTLTNWRPSNRSQEHHDRFSRLETGIFQALGMPVLPPQATGVVTRARNTPVPTGRYLSRLPLRLISITQEDGQAILDFDRYRTTIGPVDRKHWRATGKIGRRGADWLQLQTPDGTTCRTEGCRITANPWGQPIELRRLADVPPPAPSADLAGTYLLEPFGTAVHVTPHGADVEVRFGPGYLRQNSRRFLPVTADVFQSPDGTMLLAFDRSPQGVPTGLRLASLDTGDWQARRVQPAPAPVN